MDSLSPLRPYYYGDRKWDNYLLDIQEAVETGNSLQADALESARDQAEELRRQTAELVRVQETLQNGFEEMRAEPRVAPPVTPLSIGSPPQGIH